MSNMSFLIHLTLAKVSTNALNLSYLEWPKYKTAKPPHSVYCIGLLYIETENS